MGKTPVVKGWKCTDMDMKCRGFQFVKGFSYEHSGDVKLCYSGFHFHHKFEDHNKYYSRKKRVFEVEAEGAVTETDKAVAKKITFIRELSLREFSTSYGHGDGYGDGDGEGYGDGHGYGNGNGDGDGYGGGYGGGYGDGDGDGDGYGGGYGGGDGDGCGYGGGDGGGGGDGYGHGNVNGYGYGDGCPEIAFPD